MSIFKLELLDHGGTDAPKLEIVDNRHAWTIKDGCLVFTDERGNPKEAYATGTWLSVVEEEK